MGAVVITAAPKPAPPAQPSSAQRVVELADAGGAKGNQLQRGEAANQVDSTARRSWRGVCGVCAVCATRKGVWCVGVLVPSSFAAEVNGVRSCSELFQAFSPLGSRTKRNGPLAETGLVVQNRKAENSGRAGWEKWFGGVKRFEKRLGGFRSFYQLFPAFLSFS